MEYLDIPCNFVANFWVGDNLVENADALCALTRANKGGVFNKLISVQSGAMVETYLTEIVFRAQNYSQEGVPNIPDEDRALIAEKTLDKFATIVDCFRRHKVLDVLAPDIYDELHRLRKFRNKIHIHAKTFPELSQHEKDIFTDDIVNWCLRLNCTIAKFLSEQMPRPERLHVFTEHMSLPSP